MERPDISSGLSPAVQCASNIAVPLSPSSSTSRCRFHPNPFNRRLDQPFADEEANRMTPINLAGRWIIAALPGCHQPTEV